MADCNYLKRTNDTLGHEYGDLLLQRVAIIIKESVPENCVAMRVGGDEFLILCTKYTVNEAEALGAEMKEKLRIRSDEKLQLSVSFGIATIEDDIRSFEDAYELADKAMYEEKKHQEQTERIVSSGYEPAGKTKICFRQINAGICFDISYRTELGEI